MTDAADRARIGLVDLMQVKPHITREDWKQVYEYFSEWRYKEAQRDSSYVDPELTRTPITADLPNHDVIGDLGWLREGAIWDEKSNEWIGGEDTPASRIMKSAKEWAQKRFATEASGYDTLQNRVTLPSGVVVKGNFIVRGEAMKERGKERIEKLGESEKRFYAKPDNFIIVSGEASDREVIFNAAIDALARQESKSATLSQWANIAYLLYQSPQTQRGSDATTRGFIAVVGSYMLKETPFIPQDIDLRALIMKQSDFIRYVVEYNNAQSKIPQLSTSEQTVWQLS